MNVPAPGVAAFACPERSRTDFAFFQNGQNSKPLVVTTNGIPVNCLVKPVYEYLESSLALMLVYFDPRAMVRLPRLLQRESNVAEWTPVTDVEQAGFGLLREFRYKKRAHRLFIAMSYLRLHSHEFVNEELRTSKQLRKQVRPARHCVASNGGAIGGENGDGKGRKGA
jgi:hypothetical protein